jgi:D-alanyl-D-alanine carboxypeptidase (penicillin-binding protein 5/6)
MPLHLLGMSLLTFLAVVRLTSRERQPHGGAGAVEKRAEVEKRMRRERHVYRGQRGRRPARNAGLLLASVALLALLAGACSAGGSPSAAVPTPTATLPPTPTPTPTIPNIPPPGVAAPEALLINGTTGQVYLDVNGDKRMAMASTTKIMTTLVALTFGRPDQPITVGADAVALNSNGDSVANLRQGDVIPLGDLLYGLMLPSGDDAAVAIADGVAGSQARFVGLMNLEAAVLGLNDTHYVNVHGLDADGHYTTARDLARLTQSAMGFQAFRDIVKAPQHALPATSSHKAYTWNTTNELLPSRYYAYSGAAGVKTGHTGNAGYCLVFVAARAQGQLLGVLLGEPSDSRRFLDAKALLDWGFQIEQQQAA